jgi:hypothetical protein
LKKAKILAGRGVGGAAEKILEVRDVTNVVFLDLLLEMTNRHVFDHALTAQESVASTAAANAPEEKPATPDKPEASNKARVENLTKKAHDLDAVRKSVKDAASISGTLWFSYLFTLLYIAIAAGAVTHKDLLLENPVKLPFLNVELPLVAFFALAPILFIIAHAFTLMHFVMLAAKVGTYEREAFW